MNNTVTVQPKRAVCSNRREGRGFPTSFSLKAFSLSPFFFLYSLYPISSFFPRAKALLFAGCESLKRGDELKTTGRNENRVSDRRIICLTSLEIFTNARIFTRYSFFYPLLHPPWLMERGPLYHPGARRIPGTNSLAWMERGGREKKEENAWRRRWKMAREENSCRVSPVTICKIVSRYSARRSLGRRSANDNRPTYALRCFPSLRSPSVNARRPRCAKNNGTNEHRLADLPANTRQPPSTQQIYLIPWIFVCNRSR